MVKNSERRKALLDAAIDVLAEAGARGLTFRAVDAKAQVPVGTTSNYFTGRDDLLRQTGEHVFVRLAPDTTTIATLNSGAPGRALETELMRDIVRRADADPAGYLAMFELRLEAVRRPELRQSFTDRFRANLDAIVRDHTEGGFPGDRDTAVLLYLAMNGLLLEHLTLPGVLDDRPTDALVDTLVDTIVPPDPEPTGD